ncbi:hypothetical protein TMEN_2098 [Trichophyton mentagrophytes]|nr:hypothetical protein TMEN_2098 [Trichophyton mentagrophytes]
MVRVIDRYDSVLRGSEFTSRLVLSRRARIAALRGPSGVARLKGTAVSDSVANVLGLRSKDSTDERITI